MLWASPLAFSIYIFAFAIRVWLVALVPLYIFVPRSSVLWRWPVCTACGAIAGVAVVAFVFPLPGPNVLGEIWFPYTLGAFVGALTCFTGSMMRDRFKPPSNHLTKR